MIVSAFYGLLVLKYIFIPEINYRMHYSCNSNLFKVQAYVDLNAVLVEDNLFDDTVSVMSVVVTWRGTGHRVDHSLPNIFLNEAQKIAGAL